MGQARILIVDDDLDVLQTLARYLAEQPVAVVTVGGGREALDILRREKIDLAVVDWCMPDVDGMAVLEAVKQERIQTKILILTGYGSVVASVAALHTGAVDFVEKPVQQDEFTGMVMRHLPDMWANAFNAFLLANYGNASLTFDDLRRHFRFSRSYGSAQFKKHLGKSFRARLLEIRVEKAKYLLDETDLQLQQIAYQCGFRAQARLTEAFKGFYGVTPSKYRKKQT